MSGANEAEGPNELAVKREQKSKKHKKHRSKKDKREKKHKERQRSPLSEEVTIVCKRHSLMRQAGFLLYYIYFMTCNQPKMLYPVAFSSFPQRFPNFIMQDADEGAKAGNGVSVEEEQKLLHSFSNAEKGTKSLNVLPRGSSKGHHVDCSSSESGEIGGKEPAIVNSNIDVQSSGATSPPRKRSADR